MGTHPINLRDFKFGFDAHLSPIVDPKALDGVFFPVSATPETELRKNESVALLGGGGVSFSVICADCFFSVFVDPNALDGDILVPCSIPLEIDFCDDFSIALLGDSDKISFSVTSSLVQKR